MAKGALSLSAGSKANYSEIQELDEAFFRDAKAVIPPKKKLVALRLDADVLEWMKAQEKIYQSRINAILRGYMEAHRDQTR